MCWKQGVEQIVHIIHYLPLEAMALLTGVHALASVLAAAWICKALSKQVYSLVGRESDLPMEEGKEDAV